MCVSEFGKKVKELGRKIEKFEFSFLLSREIKLLKTDSVSLSEQSAKSLL